MQLPEEPYEESVYDGPLDAGPAVVQPTSPRPAPSSDAPGLGGTSGADDEVADDEEPPIPPFDERVTREFDGLLYLGSLTATFTWVGHTFRIRTLTTGELVDVGLAIRPYDGSVGETKAYQAAVVAASLVTVDGRPLPLPISRDQKEFDLAFDYVLRNWFPVTIDRVYEEFIKLEIQVGKVLEAMGKARG